MFRIVLDENGGTRGARATKESNGETILEKTLRENGSNIYEAFGLDLQTRDLLPSAECETDSPLGG